MFSFTVVTKMSEKEDYKNHTHSVKFKIVLYLFWSPTHQIVWHEQDLHKSLDSLHITWTFASKKPDTAVL